MLLSCTESKSEIHIKITRFYSTAKIAMSAPGSDCEKWNDLNSYDNLTDQQSIEAMRRLKKIVNAEGLAYKYKDGCNTILIEVGDKERLFAIRTLVAFAFAAIAAVFAQLLLPEFSVEGCIHYVLEPFQTLFLNTLQLVTAPAVFFSIMTAVASFAAFSDLGKIEKKAIWGHIVSAVISVAIAIGLFLIAEPVYDSTGFLSSMVLSIGSAITPGLAMLALILLMGQMKVSLTAICLLLGINAIIEMVLAMSNNYRGIASTLIIARKEGLLNMSVYKSRKGKL